jgi:hypothetical protein
LTAVDGRTVFICCGTGTGTEFVKLTFGVGPVDGWSLAIPAYDVPSVDLVCCGFS